MGAEKPDPQTPLPVPRGPNPMVPEMEFGLRLRKERRRFFWRKKRRKAQ